MNEHGTNDGPNLLQMLERLEEKRTSNSRRTEFLRDWLDVKAREKGIPLHGTFELTPLCNFDCKMCYVHLTAQQLAERGMKIMMTDRWLRIMDQAIEAGMVDALLTGGEALMYPGFDELYLHLHEKGIQVAVKTNGSFLTEERIAFFEQHPPTSIQITLYGADDDTYEKVTGRRCFQQVMTALERLSRSSLRVLVSITPNRYMLENSATLLRMVKDLGVSCTIGQGLFEPRKETRRHEDCSELTLDEYVHLMKIQAELYGQKLTPVPWKDIPAPGGGATGSITGLRCAAGRSSFAMRWDGKLYPCTMLNDVSADLSCMTFAEGWQRIRECVQAYPIPSECEGCELQPLCTICVVSHGMGAARGHANPILCERARRMLAEGLSEILSKPIERGNLP